MKKDTISEGALKTLPFITFFHIRLLLFCINVHTVEWFISFGLILHKYSYVFILSFYVFLLLYCVFLLLGYVFLLLCIFIVIICILVMYVLFCIFCFIVLFCVLFVCNCVLYYCHRLSTQLQLTNILLKNVWSFVTLPKLKIYFKVFNSVPTE